MFCFVKTMIKWMCGRLKFVYIFLQEKESAVSEAYAKGVQEGKTLSASNKQQPSVNVTDEVIWCLFYLICVGTVYGEEESCCYKDVY